MERKVILYIAMSLDGFIAGDNDNLDFLSTIDSSGEDYGYSAFQKEVDTLIWGRRTYDKVLSFGIDFPHKDKKCYVLSRTKSGSDDNVEYFGGEIKDLIARIRSKEGKHIYCDGGGEVVYELLKHNLIDSMIISVVPYLVGKGIRLFKDNRPEQQLTFTKSITYASGLVQLWYEVQDKAQNEFNKIELSG